jgi:hypothetical protein
VHFLRPNRGLRSASSRLHLGHIVTDATPSACVYSGQIGASTPHQADFIFGHDDK